MKTALSILFAAMLVAVSAAPTASFAADKKPGSKVTNMTNKTAKVRNNVTSGVTGMSTAGVQELTAEECKGLGGKVTSPTPDMDCGAFDACATTDKNGVIKFRCIDEVSE